MIPVDVTVVAVSLILNQCIPVTASDAAAQPSTAASASPPAGGSPTDEVETANLPYSAFVLGLDMAVLAYHTWAQTIFFPSDPYYSKVQKLFGLKEYAFLNTGTRVV